MGAGAASEALAAMRARGLSRHVAMRLDSGTLRCELVHGRRGVLARESVVHDAPLLVASEVREIAIRGEVETLLTLATAIRERMAARAVSGRIRRVTDVRSTPRSAG